MQFTQNWNKTTLLIKKKNFSNNRVIKSMSIPTKIDIALTNNTINYELMPISIVDLFL